jgi:hypothetical protein
MAGLRDRLIKEAMEKEPYIEKITKTKVSSSVFKSKTYTVPTDKTQPDIHEAEVLTACKALLATMPSVWWQRIEAPVKIVGSGANRRMLPSASKGLPDLLLCVQGRLWAAELKRPHGGILEAEQASKLAGIAKSGGRAGIVRSAAGLAAMLSGQYPAAQVSTVHGVIDVF